ncbi:unnamed protein product [Closterium sp. NIES-54]
MWRRFGNLPNNFGNLQALKALVLHELPLLRLPASFTSLASLETFLLVGCEEVEELPAGFGCLTALWTLSLAYVPTLDLPEDLGGLTNLQTFHLNRNRQEQLPSSFTQLASLTRLELDGCDDKPAGGHSRRGHGSSAIPSGISGEEWGLRGEGK